MQQNHTSTPRIEKRPFNIISNGCTLSRRETWEERKTTICTSRPCRLPTLHIIDVYLVYGSNTARRYHYLTYGINLNTIITKELHEPQLYQTSTHTYQTSIHLYQTSIHLYQTSIHLYQTSIPDIYTRHAHIYSRHQYSIHLYQSVFDPTGERFRPHRGSFSTPQGSKTTLCGVENCLV